MKLIMLILSLLSFPVFAEVFFVTAQERQAFNENNFLSLYRVNGETVGYKVNETENNHIIKKAGLQAGDVVIAINDFKTEKRKRFSLRIKN